MLQGGRDTQGKLPPAPGTLTRVGQAGSLELWP